MAKIVAAVPPIKLPLSASSKTWCTACVCVVLPLTAIAVPSSGLRMLQKEPDEKLCVLKYLLLDSYIYKEALKELLAYCSTQGNKVAPCSSLSVGKAKMNERLIRIEKLRNFKGGLQQHKQLTRDSCSASGPFLSTCRKLAFAL